MPYPVTLRQLHYFCVLAEELNFRRAAERLFISQPPLSRQIRILEDALGTPLFERCPAGPAYPVTLTEAGARLLPMALQQLQHMDTMLQHFSGTGSDAPSSHPAPGSPPAAAGRASNAHHASAGNHASCGKHASGDKRASGRQYTSGNSHAGGQQAMNRRAISDDAPRPVLLRLGLTPVIDAAQFAWIKPVLATRMPHVRLDVLRQGSTQLVRNLLHGRLDAAIIGTPAMTGDLQITPLHREPLMACLASSHPLARKRQLSLQAIAGEPVFWFERRRNPVYYDHCQHIFGRHQFNPHRLVEPADHHVLLGLVASGQGIALVPSSLRTTRRPGLAFRRLAEGDELAIDVVLASHADSRFIAATVAPAGIRFPARAMNARPHAGPNPCTDRALCATRAARFTRQDRWVLGAFGVRRSAFGVRRSARMISIHMMR